MKDTHVNGHSPTAVAREVSKPAQQLEQALATKEATIGVVGMGYVGFPLAVEYADQGFTTVGFEVNYQRVQRINAGENYIEDLADARVRGLVEDELLTATDAYEQSGDIDVFYICVPTPLTEHKDPDTTYIESAAQSIAEHLRPGQLIVLKSTTYPDTTEGLVQPIFEAAGRRKDLELGRDFFLAFSPERIDPGNEDYTTANTPVVVGGVTPACTKLAAEAMGQVVQEVHTVSSPKVAEMEKLLENIYRSVNIALVNELAQLCDRMGGVSMWEVVEAADTKPFGFSAFYPGPGLGGHCIPIDPHYLSWVARKHNFETSFITLSARINEQMPFYVSNAVMRALAKQPIRMQDAKVLILGVAFKKNVDDTRHSPAHSVVQLLREEGVQHIRFADPHVDDFRVLPQQGDPIDVPRVQLSESVLRNHDLSIVLTGHDAFPYAQIAEHAPAIIDTRNALDHIPHHRDKITVMGSGDF